jgi:hypothetical protein
MRVKRRGAQVRGAHRPAGDEPSLSIRLGLIVVIRRAQILASMLPAHDTQKSKNKFFYGVKNMCFLYIQDLSNYTNS